MKHHVKSEITLSKILVIVKMEAKTMKQKGEIAQKKITMMTAAMKKKENMI